ncbi:MAG: hypothetical protein ACYC67_10355 [Prosthecobacter sp.]
MSTLKKKQPRKSSRKTTVIKPLRNDEYAALAEKSERANTLHLQVIDTSQAVDEMRAELAKEEAHLRELRAEHQTALREVAPLLHRLPTV